MGGVTAAEELDLLRSQYVARGKELAELTNRLRQMQWQRNEALKILKKRVDPGDDPEYRALLDDVGAGWEGTRAVGPTY